MIMKAKKGKKSSWKTGFSVSYSITDAFQYD